MIDKKFQKEASVLLSQTKISLTFFEKIEGFSSAYYSMYKNIHTIRGSAGLFRYDEIEKNLEKIELLLAAIRPLGKISATQIKFLSQTIDALLDQVKGNKNNFIFLTPNEFLNFSELTPKVEVTQDNYDLTVNKQKNKTLGLIFVVDDSEAAAGDLKKILEKTGFIVKTFTNANDVLIQIGENRPDVIITEIDMNLMSGIYLFKSLKELKEDIPFIFVSKFASKEILLEVVKLGAHSFIEKPCDKELVVAACISAMKKSVHSKIMSASVQYVLNYFTELDELLITQQRESVRKVIQEDLFMILKYKKMIHKLSGVRKQ